MAAKVVHKHDQATGKIYCFFGVLALSLELSFGFAWIEEPLAN